MTASPDTSRVASSLSLSHGVAANRLVLSGNQVINVSVELVNTCHEDIQYAQGPAARTPSQVSVASLTPSPITSQGRGVKPGRPRLAYPVKYHPVSLLDTHTWTKSCRPIIRPNNGFWE